MRTKYQLDAATPLVVAMLLGAIALSFVAMLPTLVGLLLVLEL